MASLSIGMAEVDFTPPLGLPLMGNLRNDYAAKGVHDPLMAKAIVLADSARTRVALLALDLCMLTREQVAKIRAAVANRCDLSPDHILIAATHTHSGPATRRLYSSPAAPEAAIDGLLIRASDAIVQACADLRPSSPQFGTANEDRLSFCRRLRCQDGTTRMNWEYPPPESILGPAEPIDPKVSVVSIRREGLEAGSLVNFSLHPAIVGYADDKYSADYPGVLASALRKVHGQQFSTIFCNGCCGDINHIDWLRPVLPGREYAVVDRTGSLLAESVMKAIDHSSTIALEPISVSSEKVALKRMPVSKDTYQWSLKAWEQLQRQPPGGEIDGLPDEHRTPTWIEMYERQHEEDRAEVMVIRLGEVAVVGLPGEVFSSFQRRIQTESPARHTLCIELANDGIGYLPTPEAFDEGGYESTPGATMYEKDAGQRLAASAIRQLQELYR